MASTATRLILPAVFAGLALLLVPAAGQADRRLSGRTNQDRAVTVVVADGGAVKSIELAWRARCERGSFRTSTVFRPGAGSDAKRVRVSDRYAARVARGHRGTVTTTLNGRRSTDPDRPEAERWAGTMRASVVIRRRGEVRDRCRSPRVRWSATAPAPAPAPPGLAPRPAATPSPTPAPEPPRPPATASARMQLSGDASDYVTSGGTYDYDHATARFTVDGTREWMRIFVSPNDGSSSWSMTFEPVRGQALAPGRYAGARRPATNDPTRPALEVGGRGRGCNWLEGEFTVTEATYDGAGQVTAFAASFEQHCEGADAAARGSVRWRRG